MAILERWYPFLGGMIAALVYASVPMFRGYVFPDTLPNLLTAILTVAGVAIGFLATVKSILISIDDRPIVQRIKEAGVYRDVISYLRAAITWSFMLALLSCLALLFDYRNLKAWDISHAVGTGLWVWAAVGAFLSYLRISKIWQTLLDKIDTKQPG